MMYHFYILYSETQSRYYYGSTSSLAERVLKHNRNHKGYTGKTNDWELVYFEEFKSRELAIQRERQVKKWKSRKRVEELISREKGSAHPD